MRKIFVDKSFTKCAGETIPKPLSKKSKLSSFKQFFLLYANLKTVKI